MFKFPEVLCMFVYEVSEQITYTCVRRGPNRYQLRLEWIACKYFRAIKIPMIILGQIFQDLSEEKTCFVFVFLTSKAVN